MQQRPFHHGNLRAELLERAEQTLRSQGIEALSLRDLARQAGVSHGAPRSHFPDRHALLHALAERGFQRLADEVERASSAVNSDTAAALRAVGGAYVRFAASEPALLDLMFEAKASAAPAGLPEADRVLQVAGTLIDAGLEGGQLTAFDPYRLKLVFAAAMQGTATLIASRRITEAAGEQIINDTVQLMRSEHAEGTGLT